jgi:hypothetical protein
MGNPLDSKERLTLLDLNDLLAYRTRKSLSASLGYTPRPQTSLSPLLIRLHPTTNNVFTGSHLLAQQGYGEPFLQPQLHTTKLELKLIPLPITTLFPLAPLLNAKQRLSLLDLDDLLAYRTRKFPLTPCRDNSIP